MGISFLADDSLGISLPALGLAELGIGISFTPDDSTFASTVTTFTSVATSTASNFAALDTFFLDSFLLFFASTPPLGASFSGSLKPSFTSSFEASFAGAGAMGMIGELETFFPGAEFASAPGKAGVVTGSLGAMIFGRQQ